MRYSIISLPLIEEVVNSKIRCYLSHAHTGGISGIHLHQMKKYRKIDA